MLKRSLIFALCLLASPAISFADEPATQPAQQQPPRRNWMPGMGRRGPSEDEWKDATAVMSEISPERFKVFDQLDKDSDRYRKFKDVTYFHYRMLQSSKNDDPNLYQVRLDRLKVEDEIFGIVKDAKPGEPLQAAVGDQLRIKVGQLIDLNSKERAMRISRLEKLVDTEKKKLENDTVHRDQAVDNKLQKILTDGNEGPSLGLPGAPDSNLGQLRSGQGNRHPRNEGGEDRPPENPPQGDGPPPPPPPAQ